MSHPRLPLLALVGSLGLAACAPMNADTAGPAATSDPATASGSSAAASAGANPTVGGAPMIASRTIVQNASAAPNLSTLVAAVKAAGLVEMLSGPGPFTVFAPTNDAFSRLAPGTVDTLLKPENKASLTKVLTYHVVSGNVSAAQLQQQISAGGGTATLSTVAGAPLTARVENGNVTLTDQGGNKSYVETADVRQSNGVVHVVNGVLVPTLP
ncbi:fasciclin domain-containing protein [uncultured Sphingomonas sp.]|uniref:fasciclin domain-containing protein n=1 Tax=uncultured Sphingomonas sp. TaxID=158754 RepID=UPI0035CB0AC2